MWLASYFFSLFPTLKKCVGTDTFDWPITWIRSKSKIKHKEYNLIKIGSDNTTRVSMFDRPGILHTSSRHPPYAASKEAQCRHTHSWTVSHWTYLVSDLPVKFGEFPCIALQVFPFVPIEPLPNLTKLLMLMLPMVAITWGAILERRKVWSHMVWSFLWFPAGAMWPLSNPLQKKTVRNKIFPKRLIYLYL